MRERELLPEMNSVQHPCPRQCGQLSARKHVYTPDSCWELRLEMQLVPLDPGAVQTRRAKISRDFARDHLSTA
mgnify:CR=1 FL=1